MIKLLEIRKNKNYFTCCTSNSVNVSQIYLFLLLNKCLIFPTSMKNFTLTLWPLFIMDVFQLPQGYSHFEEAVYFLPFSKMI